MKLKKHLCLVLAFLGTLVNCEAYADRGIGHYDQYLSMCTSFPKNLWKYGDQPSHLAPIGAEAFAIDSFREAVTEMKFLSSSESLKMAFEDPDFERALNACFPDEKLNRLYFVTSLIHIDANGKKIASAAYLGIGWGFSAITAALSRFGIWINRAVLTLIAVDMAEALRHSYHQYHRDNNPIEAKSLDVISDMKAALAGLKVDIDDLQRKLQINPNDEKRRFLLKAMELRRDRILGDLGGPGGDSPEPAPTFIPFPFK